MKRISCAVLGATGVVGQNFLKLLIDHPYFDLQSICASESRIGKKLADAREAIPGGIPTCFADMPFTAMDATALWQKGVRIVFSALPADVAQTVEAAAADVGMAVFSNASYYRTDPLVPILIPEINAQHLKLVEFQRKTRKGFIITNANCTTTGLTLALKPIAALPIEKIILSSYQAMSGAGYPGLSALDMSANILPYINGEEPKLKSETGKICGELVDDRIEPVNWQVFPYCIRVPSVIGHFITVHVEMARPVSHQQVESLYIDFAAPDSIKSCPTAPERPVLYTADPLRPQPRLDIDAGNPDRAKGMAVVVGRLSVEKNIVRFVTLSNNLIRGAAGGSVLNAEYAYHEKLL